MFNISLPDSPGSTGIPINRYGRTVYQTLTFSTTPTTTVSLTLTTEIPETATSIVIDVRLCGLIGFETRGSYLIILVKQTIDDTSTITLTSPSSTVTDIVTVIATGYTGPVGPVVKRQETATPSSIPAYASACSSAEAYSSACSCIGATATTITVATPLTTVTLSKTVTPTIQTIDTTALTISQSTVVTTSTSVVLVTSVVYLTVTDAAATTTILTTTETAQATCTPSPASTTTATVTVTVTTTAPNPNNCTPGVTLNNVGFFETSWTEYCDQTCTGDVQYILQTTTEATFTNCITSCSQNAVGGLVQYNYGTGECQCWEEAFDTSCKASAGVDSAIVNE